jgi:hypothetical protein
VVIKFKKDGLAACERKGQIYTGLLHKHKDGQNVEELGVNKDNINIEF